jgi:hypothetical protein
MPGRPEAVPLPVAVTKWIPWRPGAIPYWRSWLGVIESIAAGNFTWVPSGKATTG